MKSSLPAYPEFLHEKLNTDPAIRASVDSTLSSVAALLQISKLPFFPDYTEHGTQHLTSVLATADKLIGARARQLFTPEDAAVLIFSVILHDLALHLSEAGFMSLLNPAVGLDDGKSEQWRELWGEFLSIARHWDDHKLVELFG